MKTKAWTKDDVLLCFSVEFEPETAKKQLKEFVSRFPQYEKDLWQLARALMRDAFKERDEG